MDYFGIYELKRYKYTSKVIAIADEFDDCRCNNCIGADYERFLDLSKISLLN